MVKFNPLGFLFLCIIMIPNIIFAIIFAPCHIAISIMNTKKNLVYNMEEIDLVVKT